MKKVRILKILITGIVTVMTVMSLSGCVTFDNFKAAFVDKPQDKQAIIQIGVYEPVTGADSKSAEAEIRGIQLANTAHPTVNGKVVELVFSDNKSDFNAAETAAQTLLVKEPAVILGSYGSVYSLAAGPYFEEAKVPAIAVTNRNPLVTKNNDYYFRICYVDSNQGDLLAHYVLHGKNETTAGVMVPAEDDAALSMATAFTDRIKAETDDEDAITAYEQYQTGAEDFTEQLKAIKASGVSSVILPGEITDAANIINQAADLNLNVQFLGESEWNNGALKTLLQDNVDMANVAFIKFFNTDASSAAVTGEENYEVSKEREKFLEVYKAKYGNDSEPEDSVVLGYDAYLVAIDAIDKAPDDGTGEDIVKILQNPQYTFNGASGEINFSRTGDPLKAAYICTWAEDGTATTLYTVNPKQDAAESAE